MSNLGRYVLSLFTVLVLTILEGTSVRAQDLPSECSFRSISAFPALRSGLMSQRQQINEISNLILQNAPVCKRKQIVNAITGLWRRKAQRAFENALQAIDAFPDDIIVCVPPTSCVQTNLDNERQRIVDASRAIAEVALDLIGKYARYLGVPEIFIREMVESRFNAFLDGIDFLPLFTYTCSAHGNKCR